MRERLRGTVALAEARARHLAEALAEEAEGRSAADLEREAAAVAEELAAVEAELASTAAAIRAAEAERERARAALAAHDQSATRAERDRAGAHKREVRLASEVAGLERAIEQMEAEGGRLREQAELLGRRQAEANGQLERLRADRAELERQHAGEASDLAAAGERRDRQATGTRLLAAEERRVEAERAAARARREAFEATARAAGGDALAFLEGAGRDGVLGPLAPALSVEPGYEAAVAAALGADADAIVVAGREVAAGGAALLRDAGSGRAILLHPEGSGEPRGGAPVDPEGSGAVAGGSDPASPGVPMLLDKVTGAGRVAAG